ncbi:unnamed protein product [Prorocentrum cordatum]|uniref:VPS9 domain-containing protein n=1 Tax=Prorocentrum cordatum TaxID=2364126 RepID=A0ABN9W651_9DINO|nr:unnamed protein product [Polarella glacialis]
MPRPPATQLTETLQCRLEDHEALQAVERAAADVSLLVAHHRTRRSAVLMPGRRPGLLRCLAPGLASPAGYTGITGITAELVPDDDGEGLSVSVAASRTKEGKAFLAALRRHLGEQGCPGTPSAGFQLGPGRGTPVGSQHSKLEAQAYYCFSKILYDTREAPGQAAAEFMQSSCHTLATLSPTAVSAAMGDCIAGIDRLCALVEQHIGPPGGPGTSPAAAAARLGGAPTPQDLQPWLRGSVERCVFARVGPPLWRLYEERHSAEDAQFVEKVGRLRRCSDAALLEALEVRAELRGLCAGGAASPRTPRRGGLGGAAASETARLVGSAADCQDPMYTHRSPSTVASAADLPRGGAPAPCAVAGPYDRAATALSQVELMFSKSHPGTPRELLGALALAQLEMRTCALEASGGQSELYSMDDVMPVFVCVLARSSLTRPFACAGLMGDALTQDERGEAEGRAVLLLESAARHIAFDWDTAEVQVSEPAPERPSAEPAPAVTAARPVPTALSL